jgi:hypothetical protein
MVVIFPDGSAPPRAALVDTLYSGFRQNGTDIVAAAPAANRGTRPFAAWAAPIAAVACWRDCRARQLDLIVIEHFPGFKICHIEATSDGSG